MSTERHEIIDEGSQIRILYSGSISTIISGPHGTHIEDAVIGAIRQQARDLDQLRAELVAAVAERDDYRDEFSGLCHTLSVGSEGRPEMKAEDWRKRVDQGIDFLTRPLLSRIEVTDKELAKRSSMLDICTQNCSDWIGRWRAEQERAEQSEARLAAIDGAPTVAYVNSLSQAAPNYLIAELLPPQDRPPIGTELIARPPKGI